VSKHNDESDVDGIEPMPAMVAPLDWEESDGDDEIDPEWIDIYDHFIYLEWLRSLGGVGEGAREPPPEYLLFVKETGYDPWGVVPDRPSYVSEDRGFTDLRPMASFRPSAEEIAELLAPFR